MKQPLLSPTNDFVFQYLFGSEENKDILISLISAILQIKIKSIKLLPREIPRSAEDLKSAVLDITAELDDGTRIDVEMQVGFRPEYIDRALFYWADFFTIQLKKNEKHRKLNKTISISIIDDAKRFFPHAHSIYVLTEKQGNPLHILTDKIEFHIIDLNRIHEIIKNEDNKMFVLWMTFFTTDKREEMEAIAKEHKCIEEAYKRLDYMSQDEVIRAAAVARDKLRWDIEVGKEARYEEGREEGREEGIAIGEKRLIEAAKKLISTGMETKTVCEMLGISESDLT
jgi:predicted transposase/invertase (TIGR01784 family)